MKFSGSTVFSESFRILKERIGPLLGIVALYYVLQFALFVVLGAMIGTTMVTGLSAMNLQSNGMGALGVGSILAVFVFYVAIICVSLAQYCSMSSMSSSLRKPTFGDALKDGFSSSLTCLGLFVLMMVAYLAFAIVFGIIAMILAMVAGSVGGVIAILLVVVAILFLFSRLVVVLPVIAIEGIRNPVRAISRAWSLTSGHALKIFLINIVFFVVVGILFGLAFEPFFGAMQSSAMTGAVPNLGGLGFALLALTVVGVLAAIFSSVLHATIHAELVGHVPPELTATFE